jgi:hypothetical protein
VDSFGHFIIALECSDRVVIRHHESFEKNENRENTIN